MSLFREDAEYRLDPFEEPHRGANAIRAYWNEAAETRDHVEFDAERVWVSGRTVLASFHGAYTRRSDADRVRVRGFMTLELDEAGLIQRMREWRLRRVVGKDSTVPARRELAGVSGEGRG
jgi:hypothetical protein